MLEGKTSQPRILHSAKLPFENARQTEIEIFLCHWIKFAKILLSTFVSMSMSDIGL